MTDSIERSPFRRLLRYMRPHRRDVWLATLYSILNRLFDLAPPVLIGAAVDVVVKKEQSLLAQWGIVNITHQLWVLVILTVLIWGFESVFEYLHAWKWRNLAQTVQHDLRLDVYSHIQRLDMAYFEDQRTGELMSILNDDINQLERFLDGGANDILQITTSAIVIAGAFLVMSPQVALFAAAPMPFVLWGSFWFQRKLTPRYKEVREKVGVLNAQLANNLSGIETIKSFTKEGYEREQVFQASEAYRQSNREAIRLSSAFSPLIRMIIVVGFSATLLLGGWLTVDGHLSVGAYSVMVFLTQRLLWPLTRLGSTFDLFQRAMASTRRALNMLDTPIHIHSGGTALPAGDIRGEIEFSNIQFAYPDREPILSELNLRLPAGKTLAIVGSTGSGKSTLVRMLLRFYEPQQGEVLLDGHNIQDLQLSDLRGAIGLVSQHVFLFHGTVRDNIVYGLVEQDAVSDLEQKMVDAAKAAEAHDFIQALPQGYDTVIGERGVKLSGGQRQRLSLARAILKDPPILVLDEATSAVDNETEAAIQRSLETITVGRSTLLIAHRLSTIRNADEIVVLDHGNIVERGKHEELLDLRGTYHRLWNVQTGQRDYTRDPS
ncbi:MAG: ABC transporter ATP-binding protein [Deltaproteobacteria bacterium]|nr:MAG: ABC transporter ATP-binding protein [Deltaproteobacteria bacterium]